MSKSSWRSVAVSYEQIRAWSLKFVRAYAKRLRNHAARTGDHWFLDEVIGNINGQQHILWRAVDQDGDVLEILLQSQRNEQAAQRFFRKLLTGHCYVPRFIITDKLRSYAAAKEEVMPSVKHCQEIRTEQACGEFSPTHARARTAHARIQILKARSTISFGLRREVSRPGPNQQTSAGELR